MRRNPDTTSKRTVRSRPPESKNTLTPPKHRSEDWQRVWESNQNEHPEEAWVNAPHHGHTSGPIPTAKPHEPIPDRFDGHFEVPITLDSTTAAEDAEDVDTHAYLLY